MRLAIKRDTLTIISIIAAVALVVVLAFFHYYESVEKEYWDGYKGAAKHQDYYLVTKLAKQHDIDIKIYKSYSSLDKLPNKSSTILLSDTRRLLKPKEVDALVDWMLSGGNLIVAQPEDTCKIDNAEAQTPLLWQLYIDVCEKKYFSITKKERKEILNEINEADRLERISKMEKKLKNEVNKDLYQTKLIAYPTTKPTKLTITQKDQDLTIRINRQGVDDEDINGDAIRSAKLLFNQKSDSGSDLFSTYQIGSGTITVYSTSNYLFSDEPSVFDFADFSKKDAKRIEPYVLKKDNASYFLYLLGHSYLPKHIIWYEQATYPNIYSLLWLYAKYALLLMLVTLLIWIWRNWARFGSIRTHYQVSTATLEDHIKATSDFYYQYEPNLLLLTSYKSLFADINLAYPNFRQLSLTEKNNLLSKLTKINQLDIKTILEQPINLDKAQFTQIINNINEIRKKL